MMAREEEEGRSIGTTVPQFEKDIPGREGEEELVVERRSFNLKGVKSGRGL